jgi:hypothetical protein
MDNSKRLFFQDRSDLRSDHLPFTALLHKCVGPNEFSAEKTLLSLVRFDHAFADDDPSVAIETNLQILNLKFGEHDVRHALQIGSLVHDAAIWPDNRAIFRLKLPRVCTVAFDARFRPFTLNPNERLLVLRTLSHGAMIVRQTNEQVKPAILIRRAPALAAKTVRPKSFRPILAGQ